MKLFIKIFLIVFFTFVVISAQDCTSEVSVQTDIPSAKIFLNGQLIGFGSVKKDLKKGSYILHVTKDSSAWNQEYYNDSIFVSDCNESKIFYYNFDDQVYLQTNPTDSYVYSSDTLIGHTPLYVPKKFNKLKLIKPGYAEEFVESNQDLGGKIIQLNFIGNGSEPLFIKKDFFKVLVGSVVVLGGLTAYFKLKADDYFEDYEFTGNQAALNQTRKYDLISGSFGVLQINFGILIYYFLAN